MTQQGIFPWLASHESALSEGFRIGKAMSASHISHNLVGLVLSGSPGGWKIQRRQNRPLNQKAPPQPRSSANFCSILSLIGMLFVRRKREISGAESYRPSTNSISVGALSHWVTFWTRRSVNPGSQAVRRGSVNVSSMSTSHICWVMIWIEWNKVPVNPWQKLTPWEGSCLLQMDGTSVVIYFKTVGIQFGNSQSGQGDRATSRCGIVLQRTSWNLHNCVLPMPPNFTDDLALSKNSEQVSRT